MNVVLVAMFVIMHVLILLVVFTVPVKWDMIFLKMDIAAKVNYNT